MSDTDAAYSAAVLSGLEVGSVDPAVDAIDDAIDTIDATDDTSADTRVDTAANADAAEADADRVYQQQTDAVDVASSVPTASAASTASASSAASSARRVAGVGSPMAQKDATVAAATSAALAATFHASRLPPLPWHQAALVSPYSWSLLVILLTSFLNYPRLIGDFMSVDTHSVLHSLFQDAKLDDVSGADVLVSDWGRGSLVLLNLLLFAALRLVLCAASLTLPLPCGVFMPCMAIGAAVGRFWGDVVVSIFQVNIASGVFAVAGAAAMVGSVTHSLSTLLILFEVTGQLYFALPVALCVSVSIIAARRFSPSLYESIIEARRLPYLPTLKQFALSGTIANVMEPVNEIFLSRISSIPEILRVLTKVEDSVIPVVMESENRFFVGSIARYQLERHVIEAVHAALREIDLNPLDDAAGHADSQIRRNFLSSLSKIVLDPMHTRVLVRRNIDVEPLLLQMAVFAHPFELLHDAAPIRFLPDTSIVHAHVLFILFRLQCAFVAERGQLVGKVPRHLFVRAIQEPETFQSTTSTD